MLNMKKLIDETDFDQISELSKRWGNPQKPISSSLHEKQNDFKKSNEIVPRKQPQIKQSTPQCPENVSPPQVKTQNARKNRVVPQVIDQDTEHFKNKLENLLNNFKTDAVSEFMSMKKEMLEYQQDCVKSDTQKYLTMYEQKHKELLETKQKLLQVSRQAEKKTTQVELLSDHIAKLNERMRIFKYVSRPFSVLYENKIKEKLYKFKLKEAEKFDKKRLLKKSLLGWTSIYKQEKKEKQHTQNEQRIQKEVSEIVGKFQKQMQILKQRLTQATSKNDEHQRNKHLLQQNLKKAFLRGVCAMNMQAMGVLGNQNEQNQLHEKDDRTQRSILQNNTSYVDQRMSSSGISNNFNQNQSMMVTKNQRFNSSAFTQDNHSENIQIYPQKAQSKNHKWKQAPIMGMEESRERQQPRMQVVRPTTEGKVIKVVNGQSAVQTKRTNTQKSVMNSVNSSSRKKI